MTQTIEISTGCSIESRRYGNSVDMSQTFRLGDWEVNTSSNELLRDGKCTRLEPKMMNVLAYLSAHAGQVISTEQLLIEFWRGTFYGDAPVQKCIAMLRKKLGDNSRQPIFIETVQRRGYRIVAQVVHLDGRQRWSNHKPLDPWTAGSPYLGLRTFQAEHATIFFGRNKAIADIVHQFNQSIDDGFPFLLLIGKSGSGKSSLLRAGVIPFLTRKEGLAGLNITQYKIITPTRGQATSIFSQLIGALDDMAILPQGWNMQQDTGNLNQNLQQLCVRLKQGAKADERTHSEPPTRPKKLIVIDQFEQLLQDSAISEGELAYLITCLNEVVKTQQVILAVLLRNDFYANSMDIAGFATLKEDGRQYDLQSPIAADISRIIRLPAVAAGLTFETHSQSGEKLDEVLFEAALGHPEALPLLEFTLDLLYQRRDQDNTLLFAVYEDIGGLEGAIARQAEITLQSLSVETKARWESVMQELVTVNHTNQAVLTTRKVPIAHFKNEQDIRFIQHFVDARLFVTDSDIDGIDQGNEQRVSVSHDALLKHWQRITDWAHDNRVALLKRTQLAADCTRWLSEGKPQDMLLPAGKKVEDAIWIARQTHLHLSADEQHFILLSNKRQRRSKLYKSGAIFGLCLLTVTATGLAIYANSQTNIAIEQTSQATLLRDKAEGLVDYMLGDLRAQLEPIGKLDTLEGVGQKTLDYYADIQAGSKLRQANSLKLLAEININRGEFVTSKAQLLQGLALLDAHKDSIDNDEQLLFLKGNIYYWLGLIAYFKQDYSTAMTNWLAYLEFSKALLKQDPQNLKWMLEVSSAQHNIGGLAIRINDSEQATNSFKSSIALKRKILELDPNQPQANTSLRRSLLGLAEVQFQAYQFSAAGQLAEEAHQIAISELLATPSDYNKVYQALSTANLLIRNQLALANEDKVHSAIDDGLQLAIQLAEQEPQNEAWMTKVATLLFFYWDFNLLYATQPPEELQSFLELTELAYNKTKDVPIKQRLYSIKVHYEQGSKEQPFANIGFPGWDFNIESTPRLHSEIYLQCQMFECADVQLRPGTIKVEAPATENIHSTLSDFYFSLMSFEMKKAQGILNVLESKGYQHPHLRSIFERYQDYKK